jgi:PAS domain S-box-containing protein
MRSRRTPATRRRVRRVAGDGWHTLLARAGFVYRYSVPSLQFQFVGPGATTVLGVRPEQFYADSGHALRLIHPADRARVEAMIDNPAAEAGPVLLRWQRGDGRVVWLQVHRRVIRRRGRIAAVEGLALDVTEAVRRVQTRDYIGEELDSREALRVLSLRIQSMREEDRGQLAGALHDDMGQILTGLKLEISAAVKRLVAVKPPLPLDAVNRLQAVTGLVDLSIATLRRLTSDLQPPSYDEDDLVRALSIETQCFSGRSGIACDLRSRIDAPVAAEVTKAVLRIVQEALTNVARHAQATRVEVAVRTAGGTLALQVRDDGRGMSDVPARSRQSIGLMGMRERATTLGGRLRIASVPGAGTTVSAVIPLEHEAALDGSR